MSTTCSNHTCGKALKEKDVLCPLCVDSEMAYCSEECRLMDWVKHKCENAYLVKGVAAAVQSVFAPYHFEDMLDEKEQKRLQETLNHEQLFQMENQHFLVQTIAQDNTVTQHLIGTEFKPMDPKLQTVYRRGIVPDARLNDVPYTIELSEAGGTTVVLSGKVNEDAIHKDQLAWVQKSTNKIFNWFLDRRKESSSVVLFPRVTANPEDRAFPIKGTLSVTVKVNGNVVTSIPNAPYTMRTRGYEFTRALGKFMVPRLKALFPDKDAAIKDMKMLRAQVGSTSLVLIFNVPRMEADSIRLEGVVYTVAQTNLLRAARPGSASSVPLVVDNTNVLAGKPSPKPKETAVVVVAPPTESLPPPPPPEDISPTDEPSSPPPPPPAEVEEGESPPDSPTPPPPPPARSVVAPKKSLSSEDFVDGTNRLKKTETNRGGGGGASGSFGDDFLSRLEKRRAAIKDDDNTGENNDEEWEDQSSILNKKSQMLFSPAGTTMAMECDASNLAHVTGLAMALEYRAAMGDPLVQTPDMEHVTSIIQGYARNHPTTEGGEVPLDVSTAIYTALDTLNQQNY